MYTKDTQTSEYIAQKNDEAVAELDINDNNNDTVFNRMQSDRKTFCSDDMIFESNLNIFKHNLKMMIMNFFKFINCKMMKLKILLNQRNLIIILKKHVYLLKELLEVKLIFVLIIKKKQYVQKSNLINI